MSDGTALATVERSASEQRSDQTIALVREALLNPAINPESAKVMADLLNNQEDRAMRAEFNRDLNAAIMDMPIITKAGIIKIPANAAKGTPERTQGRFARFEDIDRVVRPILQRNNLAIRFEVGESDKVTTVTPILSHRNGYTERGGSMRLPIDDSGSKNNVQGVGSAVTYGKRYTLCATLNIITEGTDDDGSLGKFAIDMPHERTITVLEQAEEAHAQDRYDDWYNAQGVKDRAWMVQSGNHARLGGASAILPDLTKQSPPAPAAQPAATQKHNTETPSGWAAQYVDDMDAAQSIERVDAIKKKGGVGLGRLSDGHPKLWEKCDAAEMDARERLNKPATLV